MLGCTELLRLRFAGALTVTHAMSCGIWRRSGFGEKSRSVLGLLLVFLDQCAWCVCPPDYEFPQFESSASFLCALIYLLYPCCAFALQESDFVDATHASERLSPLLIFTICLVLSMYLLEVAFGSLCTHRAIQSPFTVHALNP